MLVRQAGSGARRRAAETENGAQVWLRGLRSCSKHMGHVGAGDDVLERALFHTPLVWVPPDELPALFVRGAEGRRSTRHGLGMSGCFANKRMAKRWMIPRLVLIHQTRKKAGGQARFIAQASLVGAHGDTARVLAPPLASQKRPSAQATQAS